MTTATATATQPREVKLPCCEKCGNVSGQPGVHSYGPAYYCTGPAEEPHRKTKMRPRVFREVLDG